MNNHNPDNLDEDLDDLYNLDVTINLEIPGGWIIGASVLAALTEILSRLEHDGIRPTHNDRGHLVTGQVA